MKTGLFSKSGPFHMPHTVHYLDFQYHTKDILRMISDPPFVTVHVFCNRHTHTHTPCVGISRPTHDDVTFLSL
jgi:hypothetical protein